MAGDISRRNGRLGGKPPGTKHRKTIEKERLREHLRQLVAEHLEPLTRAQLEHAMGVSYLVLRNPDGSYTRATNEEQLNAALTAGAERIKIYTQAPSIAAFTDLMNRALDKPAEQLKVTGDDGGAIRHVFQWATPMPPTIDVTPTRRPRRLKAKP